VDDNEPVGVLLLSGLPARADETLEKRNTYKLIAIPNRIAKETMNNPNAFVCLWRY